MTDARGSLLMVVAGAMVDARGRALLQRRPAGRPHPGLWEFPGGKVEPGETPQDALVRELAEELDVAVDPRDLTPAGFVSVPHDGQALLLLLFRVAVWRGAPRALAADAIDWVASDDMAALPMPAADYPLIGQLARSIASIGLALDVDHDGCENYERITSP